MPKDEKTPREKQLMTLKLKNCWCRRNLKLQIAILPLVPVPKDTEVEHSFKTIYPNVRYHIEDGVA